jgi:hypothetical protein
MPAIPYPAGKVRLARKINYFLPQEGRTSVEPFAGRRNRFWAAVERGLKNTKWWLNDVATASLFEATWTHRQSIKVPLRSRKEIEKQREAFKLGDPAAILLAPHLASVKGQIRAIADAVSLPFRALDEKIDDGLGIVAGDWNALIPYLLEMHRRLSAPGRRADLRKGAPSDLTWAVWVESKRHKLGHSLRTIQYVLKGKKQGSDRAANAARRNVTEVCVLN